MLACLTMRKAASAARAFSVSHPTASNAFSISHASTTSRASRSQSDDVKTLAEHGRRRLYVRLTAVCLERLRGWLPVCVVLCVCLMLAAPHALARKRRAPGGGRVAVVVDERLAVLREEPELGARLVQRLGRGRLVAVTGTTRRSRDGVSFHKVIVTRQTAGWLQSESLVSPSRTGDDQRLLRLIRGSQDFDRLARARIFLDTYPSSPLRPAVLLLFGATAADAADKLSRDASRRLDEREMVAGGAPAHSYFMNYTGLDRYRKQGVAFTFEPATKRFRYDGAAWREILRRHPRSPEASEARRRLGRAE